MDKLVTFDEAQYNSITVQDREEIEELRRHARAESTGAVYARIARTFASWCEERGIASLPVAPAVVTTYIKDLAKRGLAPSTIGTHIAAIAHVHRHAGHPFDTSMFERDLDAARRKNKRKSRKAKPATVDMLASLPEGDDLKTLRDRAIILLGFWGARRRSEIAGLDVTEALTEGATGYIERVSGKGLVIRLSVSKTNQDGGYEAYAVPFGNDPCAVKAVDAWLKASGIEEGPLFRKIDRWGKLGARLSGHSVNNIVKEHLGEEFTGHALRRGFLTEAANEGLTAIEMARQSGHRSLDLVAEYARDAELFTSNAAAKLGARKRGKS